MRLNVPFPTLLKICACCFITGLIAGIPIGTHAFFSA